MNQEVARGLFFLGFGALGVWLGGAMEIGTAAEMGVGYVPRALSIGCAGLGALILTMSAIRSDPLAASVTLAVRPLVVVSALVAGFALALPWLGLPVTIVVIVLLGAMSGEVVDIRTLAKTALVLASVPRCCFTRS